MILEKNRIQMIGFMLKCFMIQGEADKFLKNKSVNFPPFAA